MSYCTGKYIEKSRGKAMKMLVIEKKPVGIVADRFGVNRSTIWRWHKKWLAQNQYLWGFNYNDHIVEAPHIHSPILIKRNDIVFFINRL